MISRIIRNKTILAALSIIAGIFLIIARRSALDMIVRILGYGLIAAAVVYAASYFFDQAKDETKLGYAVLTAIVGILVVCLARTIINFFPRLLGLVLIINAAANLSQSFSNPDAPITEKIMPCLVAAAGLWILFHPGTVINTAMMIAGITLIVNGLTDLSLIRRFW